MRTACILTALFVLGIGSYLFLHYQGDPAQVEAASKPTITTIEQLDESGQVVQTFDAVSYERAPLGIIAFTTTDGRRLFLDHSRWRIPHQP